MLNDQVYIIKRSTLAVVKDGLKVLKCQLRKELGLKNNLLFAVTLDVQKSCEDSKENVLYILSSDSLSVHISQNGGASVKSNKLTIEQYYKLKYRLYLNLGNFCTNVLFLFQSSTRMSHCIY